MLLEIPYKHCEYLPLEYNVSGPNGENGGLAAGKWIAVADNGGAGAIVVGDKIENHESINLNSIEV